MENVITGNGNVNVNFNSGEGVEEEVSSVVFQGSLLCEDWLVYGDLKTMRPRVRNACPGKGKQWLPCEDLGHVTMGIGVLNPRLEAGGSDAWESLAESRLNGWGSQSKKKGQRNGDGLQIIGQRWREMVGMQKVLPIWGTHQLRSRMVAFALQSFVDFR